MAVLVSDTFNRANETPLASPWVKPTGTAFANLNLASNGVTTAGGDAGMYHSGMSAIQDQYAKVTIGALHLGAFDASACVRVSSSGGFNGYIANYNNGADLNVYKVTADSFNIINGFTVTLNVGDVIELRATGSTTTTLALYVNGVQLGTNLTDASSAFTTGRAGIHCSDTLVSVDAFEAGDFTTGPTITSQPQGSAAVVGATTTYAVTATGGTITYQWQYSTNGGETWASASGGSGADTATYTTPATVTGMNGWMYRCICTDGSGTTNTLAAYFFVSGMPNTGRGRRLPTSGWFARTENKGGLRTGANPNLLRKNSVKSAGEGYDSDIAAAWADWFIAPAPVVPDPLREPLPIVGTNRPRPGRTPYSLGKYFRTDTRFYGDPVVAGGSTPVAGQAQGPSQAAGGAIIVGAGVAQAPSQAVSKATVQAKAEAQAAAQATGGAVVVTKGEAQAAAQATAGSTLSAKGEASAAGQAARAVTVTAKSEAAAASQAVSAATVQAKAEAQAAAQATAGAVVLAKGEAQSASQAAGGGTTGSTVIAAGVAQTSSQAADGATVTAQGSAAAAQQARSNATVQSKGEGASASQAAGAASGASGVVSAAGVSAGPSAAVGGAAVLARGETQSVTQAAKTDVVDTDDQYPLAGLTQTFPLLGANQTFPLQGQQQTFPLG